MTIDDLKIHYDAEPQSDELVFARLFARHIARYEEQRTHAAAEEERARRERSISEGGSGW